MPGVMASTAADGPLRRLDLSLVTVAVLLAFGSGAVWLIPGVPVEFDARSLDIAINAGAIVVGAAVAILAWSRWRASLEPVWIHESAAFVALTLTNSLMIGVVVAGREATFGLSAESPGAAPIYIWTLTRLVAAGLLVLGAFRSLRGEGPPAHPLATALLPGALLLAIALMSFATDLLLPPAGEIGRLGQAGLAQAPAAILFLLVQVAIIGAFALAAMLFRRLYRRDRQISDAFLSVGLVVAAFSQVHFALDPGRCQRHRDLGRRPPPRLLRDPLHGDPGRDPFAPGGTARSE